MHYTPLKSLIKIICHFPSFFHVKFELGKNGVIEFLCRPYQDVVEKSRIPSSNFHSWALIFPRGKMIFQVPKFKFRTFNFWYHLHISILIQLLVVIGGQVLLEPQNSMKKCPYGWRHTTNKDTSTRRNTNGWFVTQWTIRWQLLGSDSSHDTFDGEINSCFRHTENQLSQAVAVLFRQPDRELSGPRHIVNHWKNLPTYV